MLESLCDKNETLARKDSCEFKMCEFTVSLGNVTLNVSVFEGEEDGGEDGVLYVATCDEQDCGFIHKDLTIILLDCEQYKETEHYNVKK